MSRLEETRKIYQAAAEKLHSDRKYFTEWLSYSGRFYKIPAAHTISLFESNPKATIFADYDTWKEYGNSVKYNERSSAALIKNGSTLKHYFDISQTTMVNIPFQWGIDKYITEEFLKSETKTSGRSYRNMASYINSAAVKQISDNAESILSKFSVNETDRKAFLYSVSTMVMTVVAARCEYKSSYKYKTPGIPDLSALDMLKTNEDTVKLCDTVQKSAKAILSKMEKSIIQIINIRTEELKNGRNRKDETDRGMEQQVSRQQSSAAGTPAQGRETGDDLVRGSAGVVSDVHDGGKGQRNNSVQAESGTELHLQRSVLGRDGGDGDDRELRQEVAGVYGGELSRHGAENEYQQLGLGDIGEGSGHRGGGTVSDLGGTVSESQSTSHNVYGDSQVGENETVGDRSRSDGDGGTPVSGVSEQDMKTAEISSEIPAVSDFEDEEFVSLHTKLQPIAYDYINNSKPYYDVPEERNELLKISYALRNHRKEIDTYFTEHENRADRSNYIKNFFDNTYSELILESGQRVGYRAYDDFLSIWRGGYPNREQEAFIPWDQVADYISEIPRDYWLNEGVKSLSDERAIYSTPLESYRLEEEKEETPQPVQTSNTVISDFRAKTAELYNPIGKYSAEDIEDIAKSFAEGVFSDNDIEAAVENVILTGSRSRGLESDRSDIDVVIEVNSELKEDALFNILHEEPLDIDGITVDINPIRAEETGTLETYLPSAESYLSHKAQEMGQTEKKQERDTYITLNAVRLGDFYELFGDDAKIVAEELDLNITSRNGVPMVGLPQHAIERYKNLLETKGYSLALNEHFNEEIGLREDISNKSVDSEPHNFTITDPNLGAGGLKTKCAANIAAIKLLKQIETENRSASPEEQEILSKYVGWGGMAQEVFSGNNAKWAKEHAELKELLTDEEYTAARGSSLNAHYTTPTVINAIYKALDNMGFKKGKVLEPSMGVGNFFGCMPEKMRDSQLYGVELDSITGRIAKQLYPNADIQIKGFEKTNYPDNFFDVAIGNVPFGSYGVADRQYDKHNFYIHDYFFAKTLDKVADGGVIAFITSKGTLDKANSKVREYIAQRADLLGAIRLPDTAFKSNANTEVTSDIIFLQKREKPPVKMPDWVYLGETADGIPVNQYFVDNPEMMLGKMEYSTKMYGGKNTTCTPFEGEELSAQLDRAVSRLKTNIALKTRTERQEKAQGTIEATEDVRNFTHTIIDGKVYFRENDVMKEKLIKGEPVTGKHLERISGLIELRDKLRELIDAQSEGCTDGQLKELQGELNNLYDKFTKNNGYISDKGNRDVFREDDDYNTLCALEIIDPETHTVSKSEIFTKRTVKTKTEITHVDNPQEALQVSLDMKGRVDIPYMAQICGSSHEQVIDRLVSEGIIYLNPEKYEEQGIGAYEEAAEYLSGNVRQKLRIAELAAETKPELFSRNIAELKKVIPPTIEAGEIKARLGVSWVDPKDYQLFLCEYAKAHFSPNEPIRRTIMGEYKVPSGRDSSLAATSTYGTKRISSYKILEQLLNNRDVVVRDAVYDADGNKRYVINEKETQLAKDKARLMQSAFQKWIWEDPQRRQKYVERYNELFNSIVGRKYDGSHQTFPEMSPYIELKPHQKDAVARTKYGGNTLLAHCVGAGKSFEMAAAVMEKKRLGLINKACMVVPKHLVGQTANEWLRLYPQAKLLVASEKDFSEDNRQKFIARCCTGDYAAVIMSYEQFEKIPMSFDYRKKFMDREMDILDQAIADTDRSDRGTVKDLERARKSLEKRINKLLEGGKTKDRSLNFEQLGFDCLVVDEAHNYKNGLVVTKMSRVAGVQTTPAQKSEDILMKTQYLNETYGCKNIIFATGTPVTNSMTELYTMQRYLRPDLLQASGLQNFDDWASNFGEVVTQLELKPAGDGYRPKKRFSRFVNLPELMQMYKEFADIRTADMLNLPVPEIEGGKPQTVVSKPNDFQKAQLQILAQRSELIHSGVVDPRDDNMLKITNEARLLGLDARAVNPAAENYPDSKVNMCIDNIMKIYEDTKEQKGVQAIFCDIAVNSDDGRFSVYDYIRDELEKRGIPKDEICAAGDAKNQNQRNEMYAQLRSGSKRIVLASTTKMGTGANVQTRLAAMHHLDIPWKPSDLEQRNGRIIRQGNTFDKVKIFNYVTEDTFDSYMLNIIINKQKFISQLMSGKTPARTCEDVDEMVLNYSEMQSLATGDPRIKEKIELDGEVARLRTLESEHYNNKYRLEDFIVGGNQKLKSFQAQLELCKDDKRYANDNALPDGDFSMELHGKTYTERKDAAAVLQKYILSCMVSGERQNVGTYRGFSVSVSRETYGGGNFPCINLRADGLTYSAELTLESDIGNITRMENVIKLGIDKRMSDTETAIDKLKADLQEAERTKDLPFEFAAELETKAARLEQLNFELNKPDEVVMLDENDDKDGPDLNKPKINPRR